MINEKIVGKGGISAQVIARSKNAYTGKVITTFELVFHRFILAEFSTHRLFSKNSASSRAIPVERMIELIKESGAVPIHWGKKQPGMQAFEEQNEPVTCNKYTREEVWQMARDSAIYYSAAFDKAGYAKQICNRLNEPFQMMKVICTATEFDNFFYLRNHEMAQPEIHELARVMIEAQKAAATNTLEIGDWHVPYFREGAWYKGITPDALEEAQIISASCCAQVSYRRLDDSLDKAKAVFARLIESKPAHSSPMEHQATPISTLESWPEGVTHIDRNGSLWSANFRDWIQFRQLIPDNACWEYKA